MRVGMVGLGKLGLPVATAMASRGLEVYGYDPLVNGYPADLSYEENFEETVKQANGRVTFCNDVSDVVRNCEVVFVAVQTPHDPRFEGITPLTEERADFDYTYLVQAVRGIQRAAEAYNVAPTVVVISTVLPGTMEREIKPYLGRLKLCYSPSFVAMGTTIRDFLDPEFVLLGGDDGTVARIFEDIEVATRVGQPVYYEAERPFIPAPIYETSVPNAELIKVAYNTFIGLKLAFANTLMEVCHKTECDVDEVTGALKLAHRRLISGAYLDGGMGDGGGCHPRDNIALSWLARELDLSYDLFEATMMQREKQAEWLADLMCEYDLPKGILGIAYKPGSHLVTGSPARLVQRLLDDRGEASSWFDPHAGPRRNFSDPHPRVWLVGCKHPEFPDLKFPEGSVVIDPWRYMPDQPGVEVIRLGEAQSQATSGVGWPD